MTADKILAPEQLPATLDAWRAAGDKIVFTNGCFDLLHLGHVDYLEKARALGDRLVVGLNTDASVRILSAVIGCSKMKYICHAERSEASLSHH